MSQEEFKAELARKALRACRNRIRSGSKVALPEILESIQAQLEWLVGYYEGQNCDRDKLQKLVFGHYAVREVDERDEEFISLLSDAAYVASMTAEGLAIDGVNFQTIHNTQAAVRPSEAGPLTQDIDRGDESTLSEPLECGFCMGTQTICEALDGALDSWPEKGWILIRCPSCGEKNHIEARTGHVKEGYLDGVPAPCFVMKRVVPLKDFHVKCERDSICIQYLNRTWSIDRMVSRRECTRSAGTES